MTETIYQKIIRVRSPLHGTKRIEVLPASKVESFLTKVREEFQLPENGWRIWTDSEKNTDLTQHKSKSLNSWKLKHGDMLYLDVSENNAHVSAGSSPSIDQTGNVIHSAVVSTSASRDISEDAVDHFLWKQDGKIARERNEQLCRHGPQGKCLHCVPYEPYDEEYLAKVNPPIKFLSFHSYLRKLTGGVDKGKFAMLENMSCKIKVGCKEHPPWPNGICTKCQPNAVTLQRQKYRHVDYVQFESNILIERFLDYWRKTGKQRIGFLYGRYEHHKDVPLGIKAVVAAIYEPNQIGTTKSVELVEHPSDEVNQVAERLGLRPVGWIFTDLVPLDTSTGTVKHYRGNVNSHFLSAEECIMAASFQARFPNACRLSPEGHFGSKFVTIVVTGDANNSIHCEGYQVSNQCMALVSDDCLIPTRDAPELGYVKESTNEQYVPDVFYKEIDGYGNEVSKLARPLPVEYLLVDLPAAFPLEQTHTFYADPSIQHFAIEHRDDVREKQDVDSFTRYIRQFPRDRYIDALSDFHLLIFLATCDIFPLKDTIHNLLTCLRDKDLNGVLTWTSGESWATVEQIVDINAMAPQVASGSASALGANAAMGFGPAWTCQQCTLINNPENSSCELCGLPRE